MKGVFYSAIVMMLIAPIIMYIILYADISQTSLEETSTKIKGDKLAGFSRSIDQDLPRILEIAAKRAISMAMSYIDMKGEALDNADERLEEMMMNGTIYGAEFGLLGSGLVREWITAVEQKGKPYGFETSISVIELEVLPYDSFNIMISATVSVNITYSIESMKVDRLYKEDILVPIEGFEDPLYSIETEGLIKRSFKEANITINSAERLDIATADSFYMSSGTGASFLDRLEGRLTTSAKYSAMSSNQIGLETIVNIPELSSAGLLIKPSQSDIDYLYFDTAGHAGYPVNNSAYSWLKLDDEHAGIYSVDLIK